MNNAEEWISDVEDRIMEITQTGQQTEKERKKHESKRPVDNIMLDNLRTIRIPEGEEKEKGISWKYVWKKYDWKCSKSKGYWHQDTGSTEVPKQIEPKQAHIKTYYNKNGKS